MVVAPPAHLIVVPIQRQLHTIIFPDIRTVPVDQLIFSLQPEVQPAIIPLAVHVHMKVRCGRRDLPLLIIGGGPIDLDPLRLSPLTQHPIQHGSGVHSPAHQAPRGLRCGRRWPDRAGCCRRGRRRCSLRCRRGGRRCSRRCRRGGRRCSRRCRRGGRKPGRGCRRCPGGSGGWRRVIRFNLYQRKEVTPVGIRQQLEVSPLPALVGESQVSLDRGEIPKSGPCFVIVVMRGVPLAS